jgi:hypothetical protein
MSRLPTRRDALRAARGLGFLCFADAALPAPARPATLPFRHIHLDFHTSPAITGVGSDFNAEEFARTLKDAAINSITVFAKCHHGMSYYPTKVGVRHPHLTGDMLGGMTESCRRAGIRIAAYISTMYDQRAWLSHGDWRAVDEQGKFQGYRSKSGPLEPSLGRLCVNTGYMEYLSAQAEEILREYPVDGLFYDNFGYGASGCLCAACMAEREAAGLDSSRIEDRGRHAFTVMQRVMGRFAAMARARRPAPYVITNGAMRMGQEPGFLRSITPLYSHVEIESLPGGSWGYAHYQMASRYLRNIGLETRGMTGAFHRSWGDFGTVRNQAALDFECFTMLAQANMCSVGDHLHPAGKLNPATYAAIGKTFRSVERKEPWCAGARAVTEIGLLISGGSASGGPEHGAARMLIELHHQFDLLDRLSDLSRYALLVLPDRCRLDAALQQKVSAYLAGGGAVLLSNESGLDVSGRRFVLPEIGVEYAGPWKQEAQYVEVLPGLNRDVPPVVQIAYNKGAAVRALAGTTALARCWEPYFDRDYRHFQVEQTPPARATEFPAITRRGRVIYIAPAIFGAYARSAYRVDRQLVANCIAQLLERPLVRTNAPSVAHVTLTEQPKRRVVHILSYIPERRGPDLDIVEDVIPLRDIEISLRAGAAPSAAYLAPENRPLRMEFRDGYARVVVPQVTGHQMVVFDV